MYNEENWSIDEDFNIVLNSPPVSTWDINTEDLWYDVIFERIEKRISPSPLEGYYDPYETPGISVQNSENCALLAMKVYRSSKGMYFLEQTGSGLLCFIQKSRVILKKMNLVYYLGCWFHYIFKK